MKDYWKLRDLFKFSSSIKKIYNDTNDTVIIMDKGNKENRIKPNHTIDLGSSVKQIKYEIENNDIHKYSDKKPYKTLDFNENLNLIIGNLTDRFTEGQIIEGIRFLNFHYNWTKYKKRFIQFVKYYIQSKSWIEYSKKEKHSINDWAIEDWIKEKKNAIERPKYLLLLLFLILIFIIGIIYLSDYRDLLIGAMIGIIAGKFDKLVDLIIRRK